MIEAKFTARIVPIEEEGMREMFERVLKADYTQLEEESASFSVRRCRTNLLILFEWSNGETDWRNNFDFPAKPYRDMADKWYQLL